MMKRWLAVLALVPAVAWGMPPEECLSQQTSEAMLELALSFDSAKARGIPEAQVIRMAMEAPDPATRAAVLAGVRDTYAFTETSPSMVASAMRIACYEAASAARD